MDQEKIFDSKAVSFGRSQTFPLRLGWLPKACAAASGKKKMSDDERMVEWGVGKNMVSSILYWAQAADVISEKGDLTEFGRTIFDEEIGRDPYLEDDATLWLLHWKLVSRPRRFTAGFFMFNRHFAPGGFLLDDASAEIFQQLKSSGARMSEIAVRRDVDMILRMYARRRDSMSEDGMESPLLALDLISGEPLTGRYYCDLDEQNSLPPGVVGFAAAELIEALQKPEISVRGHLAGDNCASLSAAFRLTEESLLQKLASFCRRCRAFNLRESAGDWQLFLSGKQPSLKRLLDLAYAA